MAIASLVLGAMIASSLSAVDAMAGERKSRKWRNHECNERCEKGRADHRTRVIHRGDTRCEVVTPWHRGARRVVIAGDPFYYNATLGVYLGGVALHLRLANQAPEGYVYYDPTCEARFASIKEYKRHLKRHRHVGGLVVVRACENDCDGRCGHDHDRWDDDHDRGHYRDVAWRDHDDD